MKISLVLLALGAAVLVGCGYGKPVCTVIDAAAQACTVVKYMDKNGTVHEVSVPPEELASFARATAARQEAAAAAAKAK